MKQTRKLIASFLEGRVAEQEINKVIIPQG